MVHLIDALHLGTPDVICIALVECGPNELLLVDSGPESVFDAVVAGVRKLGFRSRPRPPSPGFSYSPGPHRRRLAMGQRIWDKNLCQPKRRTPPRRSLQVGRKRGQDLWRQNELLMGSGRTNSRRPGDCRRRPRRAAIRFQTIPRPLHARPCTASQLLLAGVGTDSVCRRCRRRSHSRRTDDPAVPSAGHSPGILERFTRQDPRSQTGLAPHHAFRQSR